ncbi:ankyrin repeat domain-containing protein 26 isoform X4 [Brienomyrus brachyistius]|uniref:ankyrin repeat domain-containing protein 26 isoform X4 n=1 Tax=Brienomyrus brachyistius TaxID=42636 RepID=UPI0020B27E6F|nr:ankyrin repeat domain-containing protein 26 isoform X4 [Brienomyrus brachyistius]
MMKKILKFSKKRRGFSPSSSDAGSILSIGYEIKEKDLGKVHKAASLGDLTKLKQLAKKNDLNQLDKENRTPLHIACAYGHTDVVLFLVENKAKLNLCDNQNRSPLMKAVQCQQETCAALLLEHSADPNLVDINGNTALHLAALIPSVPMGTQLLEHGANINADNKDGCTPLILAVTENHTEMVEFLLKEGADVNAKDQGKRTSLIIAACNGQISMIRLLLANNADIAVKDEKGWTSDDYAVINGHHACSHLIIEHGTRRRCQHSPSFPGQSRQQRPVGSPGGEDEAAFSLGRPASNRDELHLAGASEAGKVDDNSQVESISRASKSAAGDSWLSSDEDDGLQLSPKKPQKVNLKKLISSSEKGRKRAAADSRSWSERESDAENDDRGERDSAPSEISPPLRGSVLPPPSPSPAPFSKPPQVPSTLLRSSRTEENSTDADCEEEEEDEDSKEEELGRVEDKVPHGEHPHDDGERNEVPVQKRDFLSELGLGDRADDDSWDSPVSESPRKLRVGINSPATPKEESAIVPEKSDEGGPCDDLQQKPGVSNAKPMHVLPTPAVTMDNTNVKIDLMEELGLGDVDDLEDPSDWDSSSSSCTSHRVIKQVSPDEPHPLASDKEPITTPPSTVVPASGGEEPATSVTEGSFENTKSALAPPNGYSPRQAQIKPQAQPRTRKTLATTGNEEETSVTEVLADDAEDLSAGPEMPQKVCEEMRELPTVQHHHPLRGVEGQRRSFVGENVKEELSERGTNSASEKEPEAKLNQGLGSKYAERFAAAGSAEVPEEMEIGDDFDDLTQSSDTGTDEADFPASGFRNASLLIQQLDSSCIDSVSMVKLQTMFHEYECTIQREKGRCSRLSDKVSQLEEERANLKQVLEETRDVKSILEHRQVDLETELKNFKFVLKQEQEKHRNACMLHDKGCEQLRVKEEQYHTEVQERQKVELAKRNLELEMRALVNSMKQLEDDHSETQRLLAHERSTRTVQEGILTKHMCKQRELEEENMRNFTKSSEAISQLSEASDREKQLVQQSQSLHEEVTALRMDLERVRAHSRQEEAHLGEENETLRERLEDARRDLKLSEEALAQTVYQYNGQISALRAECSMASAKLEHEKQAKERLEAEADSARVRLAAALQEVEVIQASRAEADRSLQREREDWQRTQEKISAELAGQRESANSLSQQLGAAEAKANSLENECHRASLSLTEKSLLLETVQREHDRGQAQIRQLEVGLQAEREQAGKAAARQEATQERLAQAQSETMLLRQQLEEAQNRGVIKERAVTDAQERFSDLLGKLRADSEERVRMAEERSKELVSKNNELQEQLLRQDLEKAEREAALRQLQQELADTLKKLSMSEASLEVNSRYRNDLEEEKLRLQKDMDRLRGRLQESEDQYVQAEQRIHELKRALDDKERDAITSSQRLQEALAAAVDRDKMVKQLEEAMQKLEIENVRLEASAKQQMNRMEVLQRDSQEAAETSDSSPGTGVRNRLEDLVTDLQGSKITLEDKLSREVQKQNLLSHSAQDTHRLWEEEMKARARLSLRLAELEREKGELSGQAEIERKRAKKTAEQKKSTDIRLDQEMSRNAELQKDISRLKVLLKTAKKRLREQQNMEPDAVLSKPGDTLGRMKSRVDELTLQLQKEEMKCTKMEALNSDLKEQLSSLKALSRTNEHLERGKRRLEEEVAGLQRQMESSRMDQNQLEHYCRDAEERARQEVRQKLEEVNLFLQTQAASQEALEQMKAANEASLRAQQEQRMRELEDEMSRLRGSQNDSLSQKESALTELQRYRELYSQELQLRKSLAAKLERSNERLGEANAKLLGERQRTRSLIAGSMGGSLIGPSLDVEQLNPAGPYGGGLASGFLDPAGTGQNTKVETFLAKMQNELEKNITRELDKASAELGRESARLSPVGSVAVSQRSLSTDQDPVARATQQYLDVLKKNYRI